MWLSTKETDSLDELCQEVLNTNRKTDFVAAINENGRIEAYQGSCLLTSLSHVKQEMFFMSHTLRYKMRQDFDEDLGRVSYTCTEREKT